MTIAELINACERRIAYLQSVRGSAVALGDAAQVHQVDGQIAETQTTLNQLRSLN